jgi:hypothetical protein
VPPECGGAEARVEGEMGVFAVLLPVLDFLCITSAGSCRCNILTYITVMTGTSFLLLFLAIAAIVMPNIVTR